MSEIIPIISGILLALGSFLMFTGALGVLRFPDLFSRMHAAGITETLATSLLLAGLMLLAGWGLVLLKLLFILIFVLFTSPTASHALAKAAWRHRGHNDGDKE
ncbi:MULTISPECIES: monovalent cation/H(+) antiporter subunit G [Spongiibacter]|uniref:monovalent cation/H(+) antiporter subunit G n=1 Tax=Spongiibacter TaxID=630749 RepID=UPI000C644300|nr:MULTISPECIES: monovalent cation/H(+) antiporter subunit G [Spongiibacter]MAY40555.1 sodium:proton antiporter [Spongiibacter sp.]MBO6753487.1 monovalent cation/H(+) antiporter subunit G [Spongiibacter sp.]|tara:strand:+ start:8891 stop:9199 length:309 start_codon:yes stop_codon:yes gene_type:complete